MDIDFLLWLQNFREATGNVFTPFMVLMSNLTVFMFLPVFVYWCISKRGGLLLMLSLCMSSFAFDVMKAVFSVPRPFVRDTRILPLHRESGYSFPSGHAGISSSVYGSLAVLVRKKWFSCICGALIVLVALSRMYHGVHTPQDVIAGAALGLFCVWAVSALLEREKVMNVVLPVVCAAGLAYISLKSSHDNSPAFVSVALWTFFYGGALLGLTIGHYVERKYIDFHATGLNFKGIAVGVIGCVLYYFARRVYMSKFISVLAPFITAQGAYFVLGLAVMFYAVALWPLVIKKFCE